MSGFIARNRVRVLSNYLRLLTTFAAGLATVRLLAEIGPSALTIYLLLLSGTGFAYFFMFVLQESVIPLLGLSYEGKGSRSFERIYWISLLLACVASAVAVAIYLLIWGLRDRFDTGAIPVATLGVALASGALRTVATALATPPLNAVLISGGIVFYNVIQATERLIDLVVVLFVLFVLPDLGEAAQADLFFLGSAVLYVAVQVGVFLYARKLDPRFGIRSAPVRREDLNWVGSIFGWNLALVVAFLLYLRLSTFVINAAYGEAATLVLGLVFLLMGYQRQIAMGLVIGLDAMVARLYAGGAKDSANHEEVRAVVLRTSYVQGIFSFASVAVLWLLADPLFRFWIGDSLSRSGWNIDQAVLLFQIMSLGMLSRSLSESWMKLLNGRGLVHQFAPWLLAGGLTFAALLFHWAYSDLASGAVLIRLAIAFSLLVTLVHLGAVPIVFCRAQAIPLARLATVALLPGSLATLPIMAMALMLGATSNPAIGLACSAPICLASTALLFSKRAIGFFASLQSAEGGLAARAAK